MASSTRKIVACRLCDGVDLREYIDFGAIPLGNNLQTTVEAARAAASYPLNLVRCSACGHFQLGYAVDPNELYATNYTYLSGIGASFVRHFAAYADWVEKMCNLPPQAVIVDIGSNDGTCLKAFQERDYTVCGVDPASLAAGIANAYGVETINAFFDASVVEQIKSRYGAVDFVTSHNVLAHVDDLRAVFRNIRDLLKDGGYFSFEVGYFRDVLRSGHFDTIYHEHLDYHHAAPLTRHLTALGFDVVDLSVNEIQGGTIRLLLRKTGKGEISESARAFLDEEDHSILHDEAFLTNWRQRITTTMAAFHDLLRSRIESGKVIVGYGAPTKATLLMKMAGIGQGDVAYVVEDNPHKSGRFMPGSGVPIKASAELANRPFDVLVLFAWNFSDDIIGKLRGKFAKPIEVVVPLPELRTLNL
jgi:SAM-dependent methyltransferase